MTGIEMALGISIFGSEITLPTFWIILVIVFLVAEIISMGITTIWFSLGALLAFITSLIFGNLYLDIVVFILSSLMFLGFTKPLVKKHLNTTRSKTNYDRIIGQEALVTMTINNSQEEGKVIVSGQEWTARSSDGNGIIEKDQRVIIQRIEGVKLIVNKII